MTLRTLGAQLRPRMWQPGRMRVVAHSWPLRAQMCPCDLDFSDYLRERNVRLKSIFHLGTGGHHIVGLRNRIDGLENVILGVTVSPKELKRYVRLVIRDPVLGQNYKVMFADVHGLHAASLPGFDLVTLFHLGAFGSTTSSGHVLSDAAVFDLFRSKLRPAGLLALYPGAWAYPRLQPIVAAAIAAGTLEHLEDYKSLQILRSTPTAAK